MKKCMRPIAAVFALLIAVCGCKLYAEPVNTQGPMATPQLGQPTQVPINNPVIEFLEGYIEAYKTAILGKQQPSGDALLVYLELANHEYSVSLPRQSVGMLGGNADESFGGSTVGVANGNGKCELNEYGSYSFIFEYTDKDEVIQGTVGADVLSFEMISGETTKLTVSAKKTAEGYVSFVTDGAAWSFLEIEGDTPRFLVGSTELNTPQLEYDVIHPYAESVLLVAEGIYYLDSE
ncbi:MAG: hypothetical protein KIG43_01675 [Eubacteriales bacterium]|nr:hypothetical protein [Eubacteriales bacterium]